MLIPTDLHFGGSGSSEGGGEFFCGIVLNASVASFMRSLASSLFLFVFLLTCMSEGSFASPSSMFEKVLLGVTISCWKSREL